MAILRSRDIKTMNQQERIDKLKDLRFELIRSGVTANKSRAKTKEIKRALSRLLTFNKSDKEELKKE